MPTRNPIRACETLSSATSEAELAKSIVDVALQFTNATKVAVWTGHPSFSEATCGQEPLEVPVDKASAVFDGGAPSSEDGLVLHPLAWGGETHGLLAMQCGEGVAVNTTDLIELLPTAGLALKNLSGYTMLEMLVQQEMATTVERELAMQLVLDSMQDGLLVCDLDGTPTEVRSASVTRWLGEIGEGQKLWDYVAGDDKKLETQLSMGYDQLVDGFLPFELCAHQMPKLFERDGRIYELDYQPVHKEGALSEIVVVIADATERIAAERGEADKRELVAIIQSLVLNRPGFMAFADEMSQLLGALAQSDNLDLTKRLLHTIKGNSSIYGFQSFANRCHQLEDALAEGAGGVDEQLSALSEHWDTQLARVEQFITDVDDNKLHVGRNEIEDLLAALSKHGLHELLARVHEWQHDPFDALLSPQLAKAEQLALRYGKKVEVELHHNNLRLPSQRMRPFVCNLVHVMRNAVDHGLEPTEERAAKGKTAIGKLKVEVTRSASRILVVVEDDGRGIDWDRMAEVAADQGLPHHSQDDLIEALFSDGVSTTSEVTDVSGRGVGMAALRNACHSLGGIIRVSSESGSGTRFEFEIPDMQSTLSMTPDLLQSTAAQALA